MDIENFGLNHIPDSLLESLGNVGDVDDTFNPLYFDYNSLTNFDDFNLDDSSFNLNNTSDNEVFDFLDNYAGPNDPTTTVPLFLPSAAAPSQPTLNAGQSDNNDELPNACSDDSPTNDLTDVLSAEFSSFAPTAQILRNPLLPTQAVRKRAPKRTLNPAQLQTMKEAKAAKQQLLLSVKADVVKLLEEQEEKISSLAETHSVSVEVIKRMFSTVSELKKRKAARRMQTLIHIKAQEVNASE
ncbi:hypothetical protein FB446DRAFT_709175 [Lentinula raphanica]|nr:hypothetical protein FB446DRAFT_709175 [Lentinula raphanica]